MPAINILMRSAKQSALHQAGLRNNGSLNQQHPMHRHAQHFNQQRMVNQRQGNWTTAAQHPSRHQARIQSRSGLPGAHSGSEARLGDIIVTIMRRLDALESANRRISRELEESQAANQHMLMTHISEIHERISEVQRYNWETYVVQPDDADILSTTTTYAAPVGRGEPFIPDDWSCPEETDGEGYDGPTDTSECASPTPSERAEIDGHVGSSEVVAGFGHEIAREIVEHIVESVVDAEDAERKDNRGVKGRAVTLDIENVSVHGHVEL